MVIGKAGKSRSLVRLPQHAQALRISSYPAVIGISKIASSRRISMFQEGKKCQTGRCVNVDNLVLVQRQFCCAAQDSGKRVR